MTSIRSTPGDKPIPPRRGDIARPEIPMRRDLTGSQWAAATKPGSSTEQQQPGVVGGHRVNILEGLDPATRKRVTEQMDLARTSLRSATDCFKPQYNFDGTRRPVDATQVKRHLDSMGVALSEIQKLTGGEPEEVMRSTFHPYFAEGKITPSEMLQVAYGTNLSEFADYGEMLNPTLLAFTNYLDVAATSEEVRGACIAMKTFLNSVELTPVAVDTKLGSGAFNSVFLTTDGKVYKPLPEVAQVSEGVAGSLGIPDLNPRFMERSVMASELDDMLGFGVIVKTEFARGGDQVGIQMEGVQGASLIQKGWTQYDMEALKQVPGGQAMVSQMRGYAASAACGPDGLLQKGTSPDQLDAYDGLCMFFGADQIKIEKDPLNLGNDKIFLVGDTGCYDVYSDPKYRRDLVALQLEDIISGQGDRHNGQIMWERDPATGGVARVVGIDNDTSFGSRIFDHSTLEKAKLNSEGLWLLPYPRVVDSDMRDRINNLDEQAFKAELYKRLTPAEVDATIKRLDDLKAHLKSGNVTIINPNEWGSARVLQLLESTQTDPGNPNVPLTTSYVGRGLREWANDSQLMVLQKVPLTPMTA